MYKYVTSWDKISRMSQFFHMELNIPVFGPHSVLQIRENKKSISCLRPKLLNFKVCETANLKILYFEKNGFKDKKLCFIIYKCYSSKAKKCMKNLTEM